MAIYIWDNGADSSRLATKEEIQKLNNELGMSVLQAHKDMKTSRNLQEFMSKAFI